MDRAKSKRLVIDADVLHSAGDEKAIHPTAKRCRDFLQAMLKICHRVVQTTAIGEEWRRHCSRFARKWLKQMHSRKKVKQIQLSRAAAESLLPNVEETAKSEKELDAVRKDIHLIHAALATDRSVISCDEIARKLFGNASASVADLSPIVWVNPDHEDETPIVWLENGAEAEPDRMLCRQRES